MTIHDLAEVFELGLSQFKAESWPMLYRSWDEYEVTTRFHLDGEYCLVAENNDEESSRRIVGFVLGSVVSKPGSAWNYGYIVWMCVHPRWRRRNVAARLVDRLVESMVDLDGIRILMTDTDPKNKRAMKFFAARGFDEQHPHVYLCSNLEANPHYAHLRREAMRDQQRRIGVRRQTAPSPVSTLVIDAGPSAKPKRMRRKAAKTERSPAPVRATALPKAARNGVTH
jgi:ribosomal protein S18 acetylase RimI-like enzyme